MWIQEERTGHRAICPWMTVCTIAATPWWRCGSRTLVPKGCRLHPRRVHDCAMVVPRLSPARPRLVPGSTPARPRLDPGSARARRREGGRQGLEGRVTFQRTRALPGHVWHYPHPYPQVCTTSAHVLGTKVDLASSIRSTTVDRIVDKCPRQAPHLCRCGGAMRRWPAEKRRTTREFPSESGGLDVSTPTAKPVENTHAHGTYPAAGKDGAAIGWASDDRPGSTALRRRLSGSSSSAR